MIPIETIRELLDEMPVLTEITKALPFPYNTVVNLKIDEFTRYLENIQELEINQLEKQTKQNLKELKNQLKT
jgi:hypothetical protein